MEIDRHGPAAVSFPHDWPTGPMRGDLLTIIETPQGGGLRRLRNPMIA